MCSLVECFNEEHKIQALQQHLLNLEARVEFSAYTMLMLILMTVNIDVQDDTKLVTEQNEDSSMSVLFPMMQCHVYSQVSCK